MSQQDPHLPPAARARPSSPVKDGRGNYGTSGGARVLAILLIAYIFNFIAWSVGLWSLFTAACGFAQNFWHLFLARMGVGIGEAGGVAPSYALVSDYFPPARRARALAFFSLGIPI